MRRSVARLAWAVVSLSSLTLTPLAAQAESKSLTLSEAVRMALRNNADAISALVDTEIARLNAKSARSVFHPSLDASIGLQDQALNPLAFTFDSRSLVSSLGVSGGTPLGLDYAVQMQHTRELQGSAVQSQDSNFWFVTGTLSFNILRNSAWHQFAVLDGSDATYRATRNLSAQVEQTLAQRVAAAYLDYLQSLALGEIAKESEQLAIEQLGLTKRLVSAGLSNKYETAQPEAALAQRRAELAAAKRDIIDAEAGLLRLLLPSGDAGWNVGLDAAEAFVPNEEPQPLPQFVQSATDGHPLLQEARERLSAAKQELKGFRLDAFPSLAVQLQGQTAAITNDPASSVNDQFPFSYFVGLALTHPLGGGVTRDERKRAAMRLQRAESIYRQTEHNVLVDVRRAHRGLDLRVATVKALREARDRAKTALDVEIRAFQKGRSTGFNVLRLQERLVTVQTSLVRAERDLRLAYVDLWFASGILVTQLLNG